MECKNGPKEGRGGRFDFIPEFVLPACPTENQLAHWWFPNIWSFLAAIGNKNLAKFLCAKKEKEEQSTYRTNTLRKHYGSLLGLWLKRYELTAFFVQSCCRVDSAGFVGAAASLTLHCFIFTSNTFRTPENILRWDL